MPPLNQMIRSQSPKGFEAVENLPENAPVNQPGRSLGGNPYIRCPLPPFNATTDTLRQFNENGKIPTRRVVPLPISVAAGGGGSVVNTTVINQGGGSSGGSTIVQTKLVSASVTLNVPSLTPGGIFTATVVMAKSFQLLQLTSSAPLEIRMYGDAVTQGGDVPRSTDTAVPFETVPGVITDIVFDTAPFVWNWQNRIGANADPVQNTNIYITVINPSQVVGSASAIVSIQYLPLES